MSHAFEEAIITHCAPTLAGHKCGSLFFHRVSKGTVTQNSVRTVNALLCSKGVLVRLLKTCPEGCLVYVYRPAMLCKRLERADIQAFLKRYAYDAFGIEDCLACLTQHMHCGESFPHEIGVFLDYPLNDVVCFIEHQGMGYCLSGCWKVYGDAYVAQRTFALYQKCKRVYVDCYRRGFNVTRLTVAV